MHVCLRHSPGRATLALLLSTLLLGCGPAGAPAGDPVPAQDAARGLEVADPQFPEHPEEVDLGVLAFGKVERRVVKLRNAGAAPLTIRDVKPGCSCTQVCISYVDEASGERIATRFLVAGDEITLPPGITGELELTVDTTIAPSRNKYKLVIVRISTDSIATPFLTLNVRLFVESAFRPAPAVLDLRQVAVNGGGRGEIGIAMDGESGRRITEVIRAPLDLVPQLDHQVIGGVDVWGLRVQLLPPVPVGFQSYSVLLGTTGPGGAGEGEPLEVAVHATGVPDAGIDPPLVRLVVPPEGGPATGSALLFTRLPGHALGVVGSRVEGIGPRRIEAELVPRSPDASGRAAVWELRLIAREELGSSPLTGKLVVETDDEQVPRLEASWVWRP